MARSGLTFDDLIGIVRRTGVENWIDPASGQRGQIIAAPSSKRGKKGKMGSVLGPTRHHTGTDEDFKPKADYPTYEVVKEGRKGLENSLSAFGLGRWWGIYVFSEDLSWHAGEWLYAGLTDGNGHWLGIEAEGTGARWTPFQREFYPRLCASILLFVGEGINMMPRHADGAMPRGRKNDAANLPADFTAKVALYLAHPELLTYGGATPIPAPEDDDMVKPLFYRQKGTDAVYHATPGQFFGVNPDFMGTMVTMDLVPKDWPSVVIDLPSKAHLDFAEWYFKTILSPNTVAIDEINKDVDRLVSALPAP